MAGLKQWNPCRFSPGGAFRVTVCSTKRGIMYMENQGPESQWHGPFASCDDAMADARIFNQ